VPPAQAAKVTPTHQSGGSPGALSSLTILDPRHFQGHFGEKQNFQAKRPKYSEKKCPVRNPKGNKPLQGEPRGGSPLLRLLETGLLRKGPFNARDCQAAPDGEMPLNCISGFFAVRF
jgi:hypothetical protein